MTKYISKKTAIAWGIMIGISVGFMESLMVISLWSYFGSPDCLLRPHQTVLFIFIYIIGGIFLGFIFGHMLYNISKRKEILFYI